MHQVVHGNEIENTAYRESADGHDLDKGGLELWLRQRGSSVPGGPSAPSGKLPIEVAERGVACFSPSPFTFVDVHFSGWVGGVE